jgi:hypothetical protein
MSGRYGGSSLRLASFSSSNSTLTLAAPLKPLQPAVPEEEEDLLFTAEFAAGFGGLTAASSLLLQDNFTTATYVRVSVEAVSEESAVLGWSDVPGASR